MILPDEKPVRDLIAESLGEDLSGEGLTTVVIERVIDQFAARLAGGQFTPTELVGEIELLLEDNLIRHYRGYEWVTNVIPYGLVRSLVVDEAARLEAFQEVNRRIR